MLKDISSDRQVEDVRLSVDDDVLEDALHWLVLSCLDCAHSKQLHLELDMQTRSHLRRGGVKTCTKHQTRHQIFTLTPGWELTGPGL